MDILILTQYFYPDIASTGQLLTELSIELSKKGINVGILSGYPSYSYKIPSSRNENYYSVKIKRLWSTRLNKNRLTGQIFNAVTFFTNTFIHLLKRNDKAPLLIVSNPPFLPFLGYFINRFQKKKFIFLVHDVFPEKAVKLNYISPEGFLYRIWKHFDEKIMNSAEFVIVLSESMKNVMKDKFLEMKIADTDKIKVINNWADGNFIQPSEEKGNIFKSEYDLQDKFVIQYSGNLGASYDLEKIIDVAKITKDKDILYLFIGGGIKKPRLEQLTKINNLNNVKFIPYLDKSKLPYSLNSADISLLTYEENLEGLLMPSKLYTIMASGKPIIALCKPDSEISNILKKAECGFTINKDIDEFIEKINLLKSDICLRKRMGENSRKYFEENYTIEKSVEEYCKVIEKINQ